MITAPVVTAINTSTYKAITLPITDSVVPVTFYCDDTTAFLMATTSTGGNATTMPALLMPTLRVKTDSDGIMMWVKASAGTPNLVALVGLPER